MKKLVLGALLVAAVSSTGCPSSDVTVTGRWSFKHIADGSQRSCPTGFDTATIFAQPVDAETANANGGVISADLFTCSDQQGTVVLPDGLYLMSVRIEDHAGTQTYADSDQVLVDTASDSSFDVEILDDGGYFFFTWSLQDSTTGATLRCADAGVTANGVGSTGTPGTGVAVSTGDAQLDRVSSIDVNNVRAHQRLEVPSEEIAQLAVDVEADLVIVGTHSRRGLARMILGSVAEATVRLAPCPVLVIKPKSLPPQGPTIQPPCPRCIETRKATGGKEYWCEQHREHHGQRHTYHQGDRVGSETNMPLVMRS